jgi:CubicO group peptidase (beta-lactamase class C family)
MRKLTTLLLVVIFAIGSTTAQTRSNSQGAEKAFADSMERFILRTTEKLPDIPAIAIVVIKDDTPVFMKAYGMADREAGIKADENTMWYIASSTKSFTALAAEMLDAEGKIKFSDPITKYAPGITFKNAIPQRITVRDLLTHTSGLRNGILVNRLAYTGQVEPSEIDRVFAESTSVSPDFIGRYAYTNLGYNVYGLLLRHTLKMKWQDLLQKRVFDPVGLKNTTAYISRAKAKRWKVAVPYYLDFSTNTFLRSPLPKVDENMQSAGGMYTSIADLGKWLTLNMNDGKLRGKQVIPAEFIRKAHTGYTKTTREQPPFSGEGEYGLGWQIGKYKGDKVIYHHGGFPGYRSHVSFMPDKKIAVGVLVNNDLVGGRAADIVATYAYERLMNLENADARHDGQISELADQFALFRQRSHTAALERAKREWKLSRPLTEYVGSYRNDLHGTLQIAAAGSALSVRMGIMNCISTPYTESDTIRVEMIPGGNGEVIKFIKDARGKFISLSYNGVDFARTP